MKNGNKIPTLFVQGFELIGLSGAVIPATYDEFPAIRVTDACGKFFIECGGNVVVMHQDDVLGLRNNGEMFVVPGPSRYKTAVAKVIAATRLGMSIVIIDNCSVRAGQNEILEVFGTDHKVSIEKFVVNDTAAAVIRYEIRNGRKIILDIYVRPQFINDQQLAHALRWELQGFARKFSGVFAKAQGAAVEPWLLDAKKEFEHDELTKTAKAIKRVRRITTIEAGGSKYTFRRGGKIERANKLGTFPADVSTLVASGVSTEIRQALTQAPTAN